MNIFTAVARLKGQIQAIDDFCEREEFAPVTRKQSRLMRQRIQTIQRQLEPLRPYLPTDMDDDADIVK